MVVLGAPHGVLHEFVEQCVGACKPTRALHIRIDGDGAKILRGKGRIRLHQHILKAKDGESGFVVVPAFFACVDDLLQGRREIFARELDILLGELPVFVQQLAEAQLHRLPCPCRQRKGYIARDVLAKIQHGFARGRMG